MKTNILILFLAFSISAFAQNPPPAGSHDKADNHRKEKVEAMRVAFITQKLDLTSAEAQAFWPVYNEFQSKKDALHGKLKASHGNKRASIDSLPDSEIEALVEAKMAYKQNALNLEKEYHAKFKSVLSIRKVAKLYRANEQFTHKLLDELSDHKRRGEGGPGGGRNHSKAPNHRSHEIDRDR